MNRRALLGGLGAVGLASLSGCLGLVGMDSHESSPAGVDPAVREETSYEQTAISEVVVEKEVEVSAYSETITVTNYKTTHEKSVELPPLGSRRAAVFTVLTSPQIGIAGRNFNPVEDMSTNELVDLIAENYDDIGDISHEEDGEITILDETTKRSRFSADATFNGHDLEVDIHVTEAVEADDDLLVTIGVYPQYARDQEMDNVFSLMEAVDTDAEEEEDTAGGNESDGNGDANESDDGSDTGSEESGGGNGNNESGDDLLETLE
ncbi:DUF6517 family protein [Haloterrigena salina]|nr:DUF6517 family protein [Haloterrigena salina]